MVFLGGVSVPDGLVAKIFGFFFLCVCVGVLHPNYKCGIFGGGLFQLVLYQRYVLFFCLFVFHPKLQTCFFLCVWHPFQMEPVSVTRTTSSPLANHNSSSSSSSLPSQQQQQQQQHGEEEEVPKLQLPSSLVTLTEAEKRQLEDVLMRIGLKDCGL